MNIPVFAKEKCGYNPAFIPPYSPFLNPIEMFRSKLKIACKVRKAESASCHLEIVYLSWNRTGVYKSHQKYKLLKSFDLCSSCIINSIVWRKNNSKESKKRSAVSDAKLEESSMIFETGFEFVVLVDHSQEHPLLSCCCWRAVCSIFSYSEYHNLMLRTLANILFTKLKICLIP
ncbi:hypothetical protein BD560DRAFT_420772 [Blakeslea trispora]|nr:hypothetical protein BD560DRAFT_420772 [Blakeslea trispora]